MKSLTLTIPGVFCAWCSKHTENMEAIKKHMFKCRKHPLYLLKRENASLKKQLSKLKSTR